jgi:hypothetical protein
MSDATSSARVQQLAAAPGARTRQAAPARAGRRHARERCPYRRMWAAVQDRPEGPPSTSSLVMGPRFANPAWCEAAS